MRWRDAGRTSSMPVSWCVAIALALAIASVGRASASTVPLPNLEHSEPRVAEAVLDAAARVDSEPAEGAAWGHLGMTLEAHGFRMEARAAYREAIARAPVFSWYALLGMLDAALGSSAAVASLRVAHELAPNDTAVGVALADRLLVSGDASAALTILERLRPRVEGLDRVIVDTRLAQLASLARDDATARALLLNHAKARIPHRDIYTILARVDGSAPPATEGATNWSALAASYYRRQPRSPLRDAVAALDVSRAKRLERARGLVDGGAFAEAAALLADLEPGIDAWLLEARCLRGMGRPERAMSRYRGVLERRPGESRALLALLDLGEIDAADALARSVPVDEVAPRRAHAELLIRAGARDAARSTLAALVDSFPRDPTLAHRLAALEFSLGDVGTAEARWLGLVDRYPRDVVALRGLLAAAIIAGEDRRRIERVDALWREDPDSGAVYVQVVTASIEATADARDLAYTIAVQNLARNRRDPAARLAFAAAALATERFDRAERAVTAWLALSGDDERTRERHTPVASAVRAAARGRRVVALPWPLEELALTEDRDVD